MFHFTLSLWDKSPELHPWVYFHAVPSVRHMYVCLHTPINQSEDRKIILSVFEGVFHVGCPSTTSDMVKILNIWVHASRKGWSSGLALFGS